LKGAFIAIPRWNSVAQS